MTSINSALVLQEGTTFIFESWIYIANGSGGFNSHLAESKKLEAPASSNSDAELDDLIDNFGEMLLPDLV